MSTTRKNLTAFAYSGQGSSLAGMGLPFKENATFNKRIQLADHLCKKFSADPVSEFLYAKRDLSPVEVLKRGNAALFVYQMALTDLFLSSHSLPDFFIGHSFGEYITWVLSGCISFADGLKLVLKREAVCPSLNEAGYMLVVQADRKLLESVLGELAQNISVKNHETQYVLSLSWHELLQAEEVLRENKLVCKRLLSPQPYHSPILLQASHLLGEFASTLSSIDTPRNALYSPTLGAWVDKKCFFKNVLSEFAMKQLANPYDFAKTLSLLQKDLRHITVFSPTSGLTQLLKTNTDKETTRVESALEVMGKTTSSTQSSSNAILPLSVKSIEKVNKVISRVTGYRIEDIRLEQRLGDDLGLDSIKTAEIVFEYMDEMKVSPSALREARLGQLVTVKDLVLLAEKAGETPAGDKNTPVFQEPAPFQLGDYKWVSAPLMDYKITSKNQTNAKLIDLRANKHEALELIRDSSLVVILPKGEIDNDLKSETIKKVLLEECARIKKFINHVDSLTLVSKAGESTIGEILVPFFRSLKKEAALKSFSHLIFDTIPCKEELLEIVERENTHGVGESALYTKNERKIEKFIALNPKDSTTSRTDRIVAIGASSGITLEILKGFSKDRIKQLYIIGRTPLSEIKASALSVWESIAKNYSYFCLDASEPLLLEDALSRICKEGKVDFLIHSAGVETSREFSSKSDEEIWSEFKSKVLPAITIAQVAKKYSIAQVIQHSSVIGRYGNQGQSIYALANRLAEFCLNKYTSVAWPPWLDTGMTEKQTVALFLKTAGVNLLGKTEGSQFFQQVLALSPPSSQCAVVSNDLALYKVPLIAAENIANCAIENQKGSAGFVFSYSSQDAYLKDHRYKDTALFPMAGAVSLCLSSSQAIYGQQVRLRNFKIVKPLVANKDGQIRLALKGKEEMLSIDLLSQGLYAEAVADEFECEMATLAFDLNAKRSFKAKELYLPDLLFHGPVFQTLEEVSIAEHTLLAKISPTLWPNLSQLGTYGTLTQLMDAAFQLGGIGAWALFDKKCLPRGFKESIFSKNFKMENCRYLYLQNPKELENRFECDLSICDESGRELLLFKSTSYSVIPNSPTATE